MLFSSFFNSNFWPIDSVLLVRLFIFFNSSIGILNFFEILYRVSPFSTIYISLFVSFGFSKYSFWFIVRVLLVRLFISFRRSTGILNFLDILYRVSPFCTI